MTGCYYRGDEVRAAILDVDAALRGYDAAGGGVMWAPQVIEEAADHGLVLGENGKLYDTKKQQRLLQGNPRNREHEVFDRILFALQRHQAMLL